MDRVNLWERTVSVLWFKAVETRDRRAAGQERLIISPWEGRRRGRLLDALPLCSFAAAICSFYRSSPGSILRSFSIQSRTAAAPENRRSEGLQDGKSTCLRYKCPCHPAWTQRDTARVEQRFTKISKKYPNLKSAARSNSNTKRQELMKYCKDFIMHNSLSLHPAYLFSNSNFP